MKAARPSEFGLTEVASTAIAWFALSIVHMLILNLGRDCCVRSVRTRRCSSRALTVDSKSSTRNSSKGPRFSTNLLALGSQERHTREKEKTNLISQTGLYLMPATTYSPTHFRVQYHRPSGA